MVVNMDKVTVAALLGLVLLAIALQPALCENVEEDAVAPKKDPADEFTPEMLAKWVEHAGGKADFTLKDTELGIRGMFATKAAKKGEYILTTPYKLGVTLGKTIDGAAAHATNLLKTMAMYQDWNKFMEPYWTSLPRGGHSFSKFTMTPEHMSYLQSEELSAAAQHEQDKAEVEYRSNALPAMPGLEETVSLDYFKHIASLASTYAYSFPNNESTLMTYMVPVMDMTNHAPKDQANVAIHMLEDAFGAVALRDIEEGEELTQWYGRSLERSDHSLMHYGFIQRREPLLFCMDRPGGDLYNEDSCPQDDSDYEPGGALCTMAELDRLTHVFGSFPTTQEEDVNLLESGTLDHVQSVLVSSRLLRKRALHSTILKLEKALGRRSSLAAPRPQDDMA